MSMENVKRMLALRRYELGKKRYLESLHVAAGTN